MLKKPKNRPTREEFMSRCQIMYDDIATKIRKNVLIPGSCLSAEGDFSKKFGISRESVRKVLEQMTSHGLVTRVKGKGVVVGRVSENSRVKATVGIIVSARDELQRAKADNLDPFVLRNRHATILNTLEHEFEDAGIDVRFILRDDVLGKSAEAAAEALKDKLGALAIVYDSSPEIMNFASAAASKGVGAVFLPMYIPCPPLTSGVSWDNYQAGRMAASHLLELGHKRLVCLAVDRSLDWMSPRIQGFEDACRAAGASCEIILADDKEFDRPGVDVCVEMGKAYGSLSKLRKATGLFAINDGLAYGVYCALKKSGVAVPKDFSIVGCDNDYSMPWHDLTTISLECMRAAEAAAAALAGYLRHDNNLIWPVNLKIQPRLIVRESAAAPRRS